MNGDLKIGPYRAIAKFGNKTSIGPLQGQVMFYQHTRNDPVLVDIKLYDPTHKIVDGLHGIHVHMKPVSKNCDSLKDCCASCGGHFVAKGIMEIFVEIFTLIQA